jgi:hypothetical protein
MKSLPDGYSHPEIFTYPLAFSLESAFDSLAAKNVPIAPLLFFT